MSLVMSLTNTVTVQLTQKGMQRKKLKMWDTNTMKDPITYSYPLRLVPATHFLPSACIGRLCLPYRGRRKSWREARKVDI